MPDEVWKDVVGYEGLYLVSNLGRIKSLYPYRGTDTRMKKCCADDQGYLCVSLNRNKRTRVWRVHRIVLEAFVGPCPPGCQGCHKDGDRCNPVLTNLRWDTSAGNSADAVLHGTQVRGEASGRSKLTESQVREIKSKRKQGVSQYQLATEYGVHQATISLIDRRKIWSYIQ